MEKKMEGVIMELMDCAYPLLNSVKCTISYEEAFTGIEVALLIGARPRGPGMQRKDLLIANASIFSGQGQALDKWAARNVKVLVVGNPANTNALICMTNAPSLPRTAFTAMTRLDQNRGSGQISTRLRCAVSQVKNVIIWGNHSNTQYPDVNHSVVVDYPNMGAVTPVRAAINDNDWFNGAFIKTVQERGAAIINVRGLSSAASAASAAVQHVRDWICNTSKGEYVSMAVYSDGTAYDVPEGLIFSFPCTCVNGEYTIVRGLKLDEFSKQKLKLTINELQDEKQQAFTK